MSSRHSRCQSQGSRKSSLATCSRSSRSHESPSGRCPSNSDKRTRTKENARTLSPDGAQSLCSVASRERSISPAISGTFTPLPHGIEEESCAIIPNVKNGEDNISLSLDEQTLQFLGDDPNLHDSGTIELQKDLAVRLTHMLLNGLPNDKDLKVNLLNKYRPPTNCTNLKAPILNEEVKMLLKSSKSGLATLRKDNYKVQLQNQLGAGLTALCQAMNIILTNNQMKDVLLPLMGDSIKILGDLHFLFSKSRKYYIDPFLSKSAKEVASSCHLDDFLFGKEFAEKWKTEKVLQNSTKDLRANFSEPRRPPNRVVQPHTFHKVKSSTKPNNSLNRRGPFHHMREVKEYKGRYPQMRKDYRKF